MSEAERLRRSLLSVDEGCSVCAPVSREWEGREHGRLGDAISSDPTVSRTAETQIFLRLLGRGGFAHPRAFMSPLPLLLP